MNPGSVNGFRAMIMLQLLLVDRLIDARNLRDPSAAFRMLHAHDLRARPVKVIRHKGYLLMQLIEGVA
jgi:hypothetical protein